MLLVSFCVVGLLFPQQTRPRSSRHSAVTANVQATLVSLHEVENAAQSLGLQLAVSTLGPGYKIELFWGRTTDGLPAGQSVAGDLIGYSNGFSQPNGVVHLEAIEVRRFTGYWGRRRYAADRRRYDALPKVDRLGAQPYACIVASLVRVS